MKQLLRAIIICSVLNIIFILLKHYWSFEIAVQAFMCLILFNIVETNIKNARNGKS